MNKKEAQELIEVLSQAINMSDKLDLPYGDNLFEMITEIWDRYDLND